MQQKKRNKINRANWKSRYDNRVKPCINTHTQEVIKIIAKYIPLIGGKKHKSSRIRKMIYEKEKGCTHYIAQTSAVFFSDAIA